MKGCIHIYCGDGKGKTSAAVGLAVRAAGRGKKILIARFLKTDDSGEVPVLRHIPGIRVLPCRRSFGFTFRMTEQQRQEAAAYYRGQFQKACRETLEGNYDVMILDEILAACNAGLTEESQLLHFLEQKPAELEVVLTGRNPSPALIELADYVSVIQMQKHPFSQGIAAREGIEY